MSWSVVGAKVRAAEQQARRRRKEGEEEEEEEEQVHRPRGARRSLLAC